MASYTSIFLAGFVWLFGGNQTDAASLTWSGAGGGDWGTAANWGGTNYADGSDLIFGGSSTYATFLGNASRTVNALTFPSTATSPYNLYCASDTNGTTPRTLTFSAANTGITINAGDVVAHTLGTGSYGSIPLLGDLTVTHNGSQVFTIASALTGATSIGLTKSGAGPLTLTGANAFGSNTKGLTINAGTVTVGGAGSLTGNAGTGCIVANNGALVFNSSATSLVYGACSGTGTWEQKGPGTFIFSGGAQYTFSGSVTLTGGILKAGINSATAATRPSNLGTGALFLNGGELQCATGDNTQNNSPVNYARPTTVGGNVTVTSDRGTAGNANGPGVTYTFGTLSIGGQTLTVQAGSSGISSGTAGITFGNVTLTGAPTFLVSKNVSAATTLLTLGAITNGTNLVTFDGTGNATVNGVIGSGSGGLIKNGNGKLTLAGANTFTGNTIINAGTLVLSGSGNISSSPNLTVNGTLTVSGVTGGNWTLNGGQTLAGTGTVVGNVTLANNATATLQPGGTGTAGTLTCGGNLTNGTAAQLVFDCSSSAVSGNDKVVLTNANAVLDGGGATITIRQLGPLAATNYLLFDLTDAAGSVVGDFNPMVAWLPSPPTNATSYSIATIGRQVFLKYSQPSSDVISIETAANGSGSLVGSQNVPAGSSVTGYAIERTLNGVFVTNRPAVWSLVNTSGGVVATNLLAAGDNKSATFSAYLIGSGQLQAAVAGFASATSGTLTVVAGTPTQLRVETAADGGGIVVPAQIVRAQNTVTGYAILRDAAANFVTNPAAAWSLINLTGGVGNSNLVVAGNGKSATFTGGAAGSGQMQAALAGYASAASGILSVVTNARPNIIFILADDLGIDGLSCYGGDAYQTPNVDRLASSGMRFTTCFAAPVCGPARCVLNTGRFAFRTGGLGNNSWDVGGPGAVSTNERPIATLLKQAGYATGMAGKWRQIGETPKDWGYDEYLTDPTGSGWYWQRTDILNGTNITVPAGTYQPDVIQNFTLDFIQRHTNQPFFFYYSMHLVHTPIEHTPDSPSADGGVRYKDNIAYMDKQVGALMDQLDALGLRQNTLVIFSGDNGSNPMYDTKVNGRKLSGYKGSMLECGARVPFIASWPGTTPSNTVATNIVSFADPHATFLELAGTNQPTNFTFDSVSLAPQLRGQTGTPRAWTYVQLDANWYVRDPWFKLDQDGNLRDMSDAPFTEPIIAPANDTPASAAARTNLAAVLASLNPGAGILDTDGDGVLDNDEIALGRNPDSAADLGFEFNDPDGNYDGWLNFANATNVLVSDGTLQGTTITTDPHITHGALLFNAASVPKIAVKIKAAAAGTVQLFWDYHIATGSSGFNTTDHVDVEYGPDTNVWQTLIFQLSGKANWNGKSITDLRLDPIMAANTDFEVDWIRALNGTMTAPTISVVSNQVGVANTPTLPIAFTVGSGWTPTSSLEVTGYSSNTNLIPNENFLFGGSLSNRTVSLMPATNQTGVTTIQLVVSDGVLSATNAFTLTVSSGNTVPTLTASSNYTLSAGQTLTFTNVASDADSPPQTLTFNLLNAPTGAMVNASSGIFSWRPTIAQAPSTNEVSVVVTDNGTPNLSATNTFTVRVFPPAKPAISEVGWSNDRFIFTVNGTPGPDYILMASTNLTIWLPLWTNSSPALPFGFTNATTNFNYRFYRVRLGP